MSSASNTYLRLSGLASGLDTESVVKSLMTIEQLKIDRVARQKTKLEWTRDARQAIDQKISDFRRATMSVLSPDSNMFSSKSYNTFSASTQSTSTSVSLTATETAMAGTVVIDRIDNLASAASLTSDAAIAPETISRTSTLGSLALATPLEFDANGDVSFSINDVAFTFQSTDTLQTMFNEINSSSANVLISYSELTNKVTLQSRTTGAASNLSVTNLSGNVFSSDPQAPSAFGLTTTAVTAGQDASLSINGTAITKSSNIFSIDGLRYQLSEETAEPVKYTITRDVEPALEKIQSFISQYNDLVESIQATIGEETYRDYTPLTDTQREAMSETEVELWEEKAKSGLLRNDRQLNTLLNDLRSQLYDRVSGIGKSPADIGMMTGTYLEKGKIVLDETKLRDALTNNPEEVMQLFIKSSTATDTATKYSESGLLNRVTDAFKSYSSSIRYANFSRDIDDFATQIDSLNDKYANKEESYWSKFTAMETALSQMQSQSSWLSQQFS